LVNYFEMGVFTWVTTCRCQLCCHWSLVSQPI